MPHRTRVFIPNMAVDQKIQRGYNHSSTVRVQNCRRETGMTFREHVTTLSKENGEAKEPPTGTRVPRDDLGPLPCELMVVRKQSRS